MNKYGISLWHWDALFEAQGKRCAVCRTDDPGGVGPQGWSTDHDHATGKVRGILCCNCNHMLGNAKDDTSTLLAAVDYLIRHAAECTGQLALF